MSDVGSLLAKRTLTNIAYVTGGFAVSKAGLLLAMILLARIYAEQAEVFGRISYAMAVSAFAIGCYLSVDIVGTRVLAGQKENRRHLIGSIMLYRLLAATGIYAILVGVSWLLFSDPQERNLILVFGARLFPIALFLGWYFQATQKMLWFSLGLFIQSWGFLACLVLFVDQATPTSQIPLWLLLAFGISSLLLYSIMTKKERFVLFRVDFAFWKKLTSSVAFLAGADLVYLLYMQGSVLVLKTLEGYEAAASFNAIYILFCGIIFLIGGIPTVLFPRFVEEINKGEHAAIRLLFERSLFYMPFIVLPVGILGALCAEDIAQLVYKGKYSDAVVCFQVLMINVAIMCINAIQEKGLIAFGRERTVAAIHAIMGVVGITLNVLLVRRFGLLGSSIALVCAEIVAVSLMSVSFVRLTGVRFWRYLAWPVVPVIAMAGIVNLASEINLFIRVAIGLCAYATVCGIILSSRLCKIP